MTITITISPETQHALEEQAHAAGTDIETFVADTVREKLAESSPPARVPRDQWQKVFDAWIAQQPPRGANLDDSRESIYD